MNRVKGYFKNKTGEQVFSLCLLISVTLIMLFCAIVRLCGGLWFAADMSKITAPSKFWQETVKATLLIFELLFVYKILCRTHFFTCFCIAIAETLVGILLGETVNNSIVSNLFYMACYFIIPLCFRREWFSLLESAILYGLQLLYSVLFMVGRIGGIDENAAYTFAFGIISTIDYKLFIIAMYLFIKYFGGIKLWKKQKRLIFQTAPLIMK